MGAKKPITDKTTPVLPFKKNDSILTLDKKLLGNSSAKLTPEDFFEKDIDDKFKVRALSVSISLMADFVRLYDDHIGMKYFLDPFEKMLSRLTDQKFLPKSLAESIKTKLDEFITIKTEKKMKFPEPEKKTQPLCSVKLKAPNLSNKS